MAKFLAISARSVSGIFALIMVHQAAIEKSMAALLLIRTSAGVAEDLMQTHRSTMNCWHDQQDANRYDLARRLCKLLIEWRISTEDMKLMTEAQWLELRLAATPEKYRELAEKPSEKTIELTLDLLDLARTPVVAKAGKS